MKKILISENQYRLLKEYQNEVTYYKFYTEVLKFLKELLENPSEAEPSDLLKNHGINRKDLIQGLIKRNIITRSNKITELSNEETGKQESKMLVKYNVLRRDFEKKLHRLHIELCECVKPKVKLAIEEEIDEDMDSLEEDGSVGGMSCAFAMQGGSMGNNPSAGQYDVPMGTVQKRDFWLAGNKQNKKKKNAK